MTNLNKIKFYLTCKLRSLSFRFSEAILFLFNKEHREELKRNNEPIFVKVKFGAK